MTIHYDYFKPILNNNGLVLLMMMMKRSARVDAYLVLYGCGLLLISLLNYYWAASYDPFNIGLTFVGSGIVAVNIWSRRRTMRRIKHLQMINKHLRGYCTTFSNIAREHHADQLHAALIEDVP